jgi:AraC-like DNA-binding protein
VPTAEGGAIMTAKISQQKIVDLWDKEYGVIEIAGKLGCSKQYVSYVLKQQGINPREAGHRGTNRHKRNAITALYMRGVKPLTIAAEIGCTQDTVYAAIGYHLTPEEREQARKARNTLANQIERLYLQGMKQSHIARELNTAQTYVSDVLKERGYPRKVYRRKGAQS